MTSYASKIHRASGAGRGKPVLICILATVSFFCCLVARSDRKRGNRQTDRHTNGPSTVTLAAHAHRGLISTRFHSNSSLWNAKCDKIPNGTEFGYSTSISVEFVFPNINEVRTIIVSLSVKSPVKSLSRVGIGIGFTLSNTNTPMYLL